MGLSRATKVPTQAALLRELNVTDLKPQLLPAAPSDHRAVNVDLVLGLVEMQRDGQFSACRNRFLGIDAAALRRQVPDKATAAGVVVQKEGGSMCQ